MSHNHSVTVSTAFRNCAPSDALRESAEEKIAACLKKYIHHDTEAHLVLKVEKTRQIAELSFNVDGAHFQSKEESDDMYSSIDKLLHNVARQLSKHKEKLTEHHRS